MSALCNLLTEIFYPRIESVSDSTHSETDHPLERKAVDVSGQLGSLYDASSELLVDKCSVKYRETSQQQGSICRIFFGNQSNDLINYLIEMDFNDALRESILLGMVTPTGVTSLIDYKQPVNKNTCFFYYSYKSREEKINVTPEEVDRTVLTPPSSTIATHMITKILWGFEVLCVIQVPENQSSDAVADLLHAILSQSRNHDESFKLSEEERIKVAQLTNVTVFGSEKCVDNSNASLLTVLTCLRDWENDNTFHHPLVYTMHPLRWLYKLEQFLDPSNMSNRHIEQIHPILTHLNTQLKDLELMFQNLSVNLSSSSINQMLKDAQEQFHFLLDTRNHRLERLRKVLVDTRRHQIASMTVDDIMLDKDYTCLQETEMTMFQNNIQRLVETVMLIDRLSNDNIEYVNLLDLFPHEKRPETMEDFDEVWRYAISKEESLVIVWYSTDRLKQEKEGRWEQIYEELISERQQTTERIVIIYADFSLSQHTLNDFDVRRLPASPSSEYSLNHHRSTESRVDELFPGRLPSVTDINVLLLGETGVGKSTFINAFVNYLMFDTLQEAEQDELVVLIPVSFLITIGDQFDDFTVQFGDPNTNEKYEHEGQSVIQQCKSYVFNLNDRVRLRLIDTPGMGDTRGVDQDMKNIDHILTYVNNLSHLNAVCLLLKPNSSRLNVVFRSCVNQLLTYLTPSGYSNIIFCFTNARATFFTPGNTGPLLRKMLKQEDYHDILFEKANTFCFDSESFRYLAARKCGVTFDQFQNEECIKSWTTSVTQSVRLLDFIQTRKPYYLDECQSPRKAALEISILARPLMEALRLTLYNWKQREANLIGHEMILHSNPVTTEICSNCAQSSIVEVGPFWLIEYGSTKGSAGKQCLCPLDERQFLIEATVKHDFVAQSPDRSIDELQNFFNNSLYKFDRLTHFLQQNKLVDQGDSFTAVLKRFLDEERHISMLPDIDLKLNERVQQILHSIRELREQNSQQLSGYHEELSLIQVYEIISEIKSIPTVQQQVECIKTSRHLKMEATEYHVNIPSIKNTRFGELTNSFS